MSITQPTPLEPWADTGDKVQPTNLEIAEGWPSSSVPPSRQRFNWILNYCMNAVRYLCRYGIPQWHTNEVYPQYARVIGSDGVIYKSSVAGNTGNNPVSSPGQWTEETGGAGGSLSITTAVLKVWSVTSGSLFDNTATPFTSSSNNNGTINFPTQTVTVSGAPTGATHVFVRCRFDCTSGGKKRIYVRAQPANSWELKIDSDPMFIDTAPEAANPHVHMFWTSFLVPLHTDNTFQFYVEYSNGHEGGYSYPLNIEVQLHKEAFLVDKTVVTNASFA